MEVRYTVRECFSNSLLDSFPTSREATEYLQEIRSEYEGISLYIRQEIKQERFRLKVAAQKQQIHK